MLLPQFSPADLSLEPNPFEQSFRGAPETPGATRLPSVAALTSPSSLLPNCNMTPFNWGGGSLWTGPLSPGMLSGQANDYFGDTPHLRGGSPTPNESSLSTGLAPGGSGSMFPAQSLNSQLSAQLANGGATPSTLDFHRTAISAAAKSDQNGAPPRSQGQQPPPPPQQQQPSVASQPQEMPNGATTAKPEAKPASGPFSPHNNDAANGLFMLAQGRNGAQSTNQFAVTSGAPGHAHTAPVAPQNMNTSPQVSSINGGSIGSSRGMSGSSIASDESEQARPNTRGKGKRNLPPTSSRRKADEPPFNAPANKKSKINAAAINGDMDFSDDESKMKLEEGGSNVAALKCRQRKKRWLTNLQTKVEMFNTENDALTAQVTQLREEAVNLKTLLFAHKDCPVTHRHGLHGAFVSQAIEPFNPQMNPYGMAAPTPNQVMAGQGVQRRFS
ncbi:Transcription factor [Fusarium falciforme]|nr:Transcription factor [Fusarium falciforme]